MKKQDTEVDHIKVRENHSPAASFRRLDGLSLPLTRSRVDTLNNRITCNTGWEAVRPRHDPVAKVVNVACATPPAGNEKLGAGFRFDILEVLHAGIIRIGAEAVFLVVGTTENRISRGCDGKDDEDPTQAELRGVDGEVSGLEVVEKRNPNHVAEGEHEPESVHDDVHGRQKSWFHVKTIEDVETLKGGRQDDRIGDVAICAVLMGDIRQIQNDPSKQARSHLTPDLDVNRPRRFTHEWNGQFDSGVKLPANEEVIQDVACVPARRQLPELGVQLTRSGNRETSEVNEDCDDSADDQVGSDHLQIVVPEESP